MATTGTSSAWSRSQAAVLGTVAGGAVTVPRMLAISVAVDAAGPRGRGRGRRHGVGADGIHPGRGHKEVLHALAGYLARAVADERVQKVSLEGDLGAVGVVGHRELSGGSGQARIGGIQRWPKRRQSSADEGSRGGVGLVEVQRQSL